VARPKVCANLQVLRPSERQWKPRLPQAATTLAARLTVCGEHRQEKYELRMSVINKKQNGK